MRDLIEAIENGDNEESRRLATEMVAGGQDLDTQDEVSEHVLRLAASLQVF